MAGRAQCVLKEMLCFFFDKDLEFPEERGPERRTGFLASLGGGTRA